MKEGSFHLIMVLFLVLSLSSVDQSKALRQWGVKEGDSITYIITEFHQYGLDDPKKGFFYCTDETGKNINVPKQIGSLMTYEITVLGPVVAGSADFSYKVTYTNGNSQTTTQEKSGNVGDHSQLKPTINASYWEWLAQEYYPDVFNYTMTVENDHVIVQQERYQSNRTYYYEKSNGQIEKIELQNVTQLHRYYRSWESGWIVYSLWKTYNSTSTLYEYEYIQKSDKPYVSGSFSLISGILGMNLAVLIYIKYKRL